jgi:WD40 repeat protein
VLVWSYIFLTCSEFLRCHPKDITNVAFHRSYPLFASCSDDCTAYVFHGTVYSDLNQNPLVVPLEILRGHTSSNGRGERFEYLLLLSVVLLGGNEDCKDK